MPLPWSEGMSPLMLAPMQGVTNRALRSVFGDTAAPDVLFTEFVRVRPRAKKPIANSDFVEALTTVPGIPLVVQVIGSADEGVVEATRALVQRGVHHVNVNMGCPFGRMTSVLAGGGMFRNLSTVEPMLAQLRKMVPGSLSVKTRAGIDDERQIFDVLPLFENAGVDFVVVHARTVKQKYKGVANHGLTEEIVSTSKLPVIANGDIRDATQASAVLSQTGAAGLMLGRGAVADPLLFHRIRGTAPPRPSGDPRRRELAEHFIRLLTAYGGMFCGDAQVLSKLKETLAHIEDEDQKRWVKALRKRKRVDGVMELLREAVQPPA